MRFNDLARTMTDRMKNSNTEDLNLIIRNIDFSKPPD